MNAVRFGRVWEIKTLEDYVKAMGVLFENQYCATISGYPSIVESETNEIKRQQNEVYRQAKENNFFIGQ